MVRNTHIFGRRVAAAALAAGLFLAALAPRPAMAQCEQFVTANTSLTALATQDTSNINKYINQEKSFIERDLEKTATFEVEARLEEFDSNIRSWLSHWWEKRLRPALKNMTKQLSASTVDQTLTVGAMTDAQLTIEALQKRQELMDEARRLYMPSETACQSGSLGSAQTKAFHTSRSMTKAISNDISKQGGNTKGSPSAAGRGAEIREHWEEYVAKFCDNTRGDLGCTTPGTRPGTHKDIPGLLWKDSQTIDLTDEDNRIMVLAALRYLVSPAASDPIPATAIDSSNGRQGILTRRSRLARTNAVLNAAGQMLSERIGVKMDSGSNNTFRLMRRLSGISDENISDDPSYSELREALARDRFMNPQYIASLVTNPEQVGREQGAINATRLQLMNDLYRRYEEMLFMEAAAYSFDLDKQKPSTSISTAPVK